MARAHGSRGGRLARTASLILGFACASAPAAPGADVACTRGFQRVDRVSGLGIGAPIIWGDFNQDGRPDYAYGDTRTTVVALNRGNEVFDVGSVLEQMPSGRSLTLEAANDVNHDGHLDLVYRFTNSFAVRFGDGTGNFSDPVVSAAVPLIWETGEVAAGDVDGDGTIDFATAGSRSVNIIQGHADGTFTLAATLPVTWLSVGDMRLTIGDFDGDGRPDVARAARSTSLTGPLICVLWNEGGLHFTETCSGFSDTPIHLSALDLDGTGRDELVGSGLDQLLVVSGKDRSLELDFRSIAGVENLQAVAATDLDGDGLRDLVLEGGGVVAVVWGTGQGRYSPPSEFFLSYATPPYGSTLNAVSVLDLNGDGLPDIAAGVTVLHGKPGSRLLDAPSVFPIAGYLNPRHLHVDFGTYVSTQVGDVDGDGRPDIVVSDSTTGNLRTMFAAPDGMFRPGPMRMQAGMIAALADFDGDGKLDLAANVYQGVPSVLYGDGTGNFGPASTTTTTGKFVAGMTLIGGRTDVLALSGQDLQVVTIGSDRTAAVSTVRHLPSQPSAVDVVDIDGDGGSDMIVTFQTSTDSPFQVIMQTAEGWVDGPALACPHPGACYYDLPYHFITGDVDGDGRQDLIIWNESGCDVFLRGPDGGLAKVSSLPRHGAFLRNARLTDVDGDGLPDVVALYDGGSGNQGTVMVAKNVGNGLFRETGFAYSAASSSIVGTSDVTGDARPGLTLVSPRGVQLLRNVCDSGPVRAIAIPSAPLPGQPVDVVASFTHWLASAFTSQISIFEGTSLLHSETLNGTGTVRWTSPPLGPGLTRFRVEADVDNGSACTTELDVRTAVRSRRNLPRR